MSRHYTSIISSIFGKFANTSFPLTLQYIINRFYIYSMGLDMSDFKSPCEYRTLNKLFTRELIKTREIPTDENIIISPCDARISDYGKVKDGKAYQIKGMEYSLDELLGKAYIGKAKDLEGGEFVNMYLSPKDYHRYHIPMDLKIHSLTHIAGKLYPVNFPLLLNKQNLFIENERVVIECEDNRGFIHFLVLVGALNVGKMVVSFEDRVNTNSSITTPQYYEYKDLSMSRGELLGWFEMGSTVLMFSQKGALISEVAINQKVKFTQRIGIKI
jgi:phosphatidylserine decarboxylase